MARTFKDALDELLDTMSIRELAGRLHELRPSQSVDDWRSAIRDMRREQNPRQPTEVMIALFAEAARKPRAFFPPAARPPTTAERFADLDDRLDALEDETRRLEGLLRRLLDDQPGAPDQPGKP